MTPTSTRLAAVTLLCLSSALPCSAESLASSASSAGSASLGSLSESVKGSSNSSSPADKVAEGDYRVIEVAAVAERPGMLRVTLQAQAAARDGEGPLWLVLPQQALGQRELVPGDTVSAKHRPYGIEFARVARGGAAREAFFLVLADDWINELAPRALKL